jgi:hypothetical protein
MSQIQFGLPLNSPSTQSLLPVLDQYGKSMGFFPIASHTFTGAETTYALASGSVTITTVTLPPKIQNSSNISRVPQYMAAVYTPAQVSLKPWLGHTEFVSSAIPNNIGFYSWWSMPTSGWFQHFGEGVYLESFQFNMNKYVYAAPAGQGNPTVSNGALRWACTVNQQAFQTNSSFVDFNWVDLFAAAIKEKAGSVGQAVIPLSITTTANPAGGFFKASVVQAQGAQVTYPGGVQMFNTIRILRLADPTAGSYVFTFNVTDDQNNTTAVTLTLTVV